MSTPACLFCGLSQSDPKAWGGCAAPGSSAADHDWQKPAPLSEVLPTPTDALRGLALAYRGIVGLDGAHDPPLRVAERVLAEAETPSDTGRRVMGLDRMLADLRARCLAALEADLDVVAEVSDSLCELPLSGSWREFQPGPTRTYKFTVPLL
jgi:hypothetical protein